MTKFPAAVAALLLAACGTGNATSAVTTRDSAGVTIIEHPAGAIDSAPAWSLGAPTTVIAHGASAEETFTWINSATRLADGRMVVVHGEEVGATVLLFGTDGAFERMLGRPGAGPGEFRAAEILGRPAGDTLTIYDPVLGRRTRLLTSGEVVATHDVARLGVMTIGQPTGVLTDGRMISLPFYFMDTSTAGGSRYRRKVAVLVTDPVAPRLDTATTELPGDEVFLLTVTFGGRTRTLPTPVVYGAQTILRPVGAEVRVATNETSALDSYTLPWKLVRSVRFAGTRRPVDQEAKDAKIADAMANLDASPGITPEFRKQFVDAIGRAVYADSMPWYSAITTDGVGAEWLRQQRSQADSVPHYLVIGHDGHLAARADLPNGSRLLWVGTDQVLIAMHDEDEVERLELRPILKTGVRQ